MDTRIRSCESLRWLSYVTSLARARRRICLFRRIHLLRSSAWPARRLYRNNLATRTRKSGCPRTRRTLHTITRRWHQSDRRSYRSRISRVARRRTLAITSLVRKVNSMRPQRKTPAMHFLLAIGLIGFSTYLFILRGFYAHGDTRTPFFLNVGENGSNVVLAVILVGPFGVFGLGLSLGIAYLVAAAVSLIILRQRHAHTLHAIALTRDIAVLSVSAGIGGCYLALDVRTERAFLARNRRHLGAFAPSAVLLRPTSPAQKYSGRLEEPESTRRVAHCEARRDHPDGQPHDACLEEAQKSAVLHIT